MEAATTLTNDNKKGICGSTIKMIAIVSMLIDHTAATILERMLSQQLFPEMEGWLNLLYLVMRGIGRLGFPIFIFLLVEGLEHTRNRWKYLLRLVIFALVSELPFDMAFTLTKAEIFRGKGRISRSFSPRSSLADQAGGSPRKNPARRKTDVRTLFRRGETDD